MVACSAPFLVRLGTSTTRLAQQQPDPGTPAVLPCNPADPGRASPTPFTQVQTNGRKTPIAAVQDTLKDLEGEVQDIRQQFIQAVGAEAAASAAATTHLALVAAARAAGSMPASCVPILTAW